jgi:hypothetical protein
MSLKFRVLSIHFTSEAFVGNPKMSDIASYARDTFDKEGSTILLCFCGTAGFVVGGFAGFAALLLGASAGTKVDPIVKTIFALQ